MNTKKPATGGRFKNVPYFNGGVFQTVEAIDLQPAELLLICEPDAGAATKNWSKVNPAIFGAIFQQSMDAKERHAYGAHFTSEADIMRLVTPTISRPWTERIAKASTINDWLALRTDILNSRALYPPSATRQFLSVAYKGTVRTEP